MNAKNYSEQAIDMLRSIRKDIFPVLEKGEFDKEINSHRCQVEILNNDFLTIWVKWGPYDCELRDLPVTAMATVADNILA